MWDEHCTITTASTVLGFDYLIQYLDEISGQFFMLYDHK